MNWVGILYIKESNVYLNGKCIANSFEEFHNACCFYAMPKIMIMYVSKHLLIEKDIRRRNLGQFFNFIIYHKSQPFIYIHEHKKMYGFSIVLGIILTAIISLIQLGAVHQFELPISTRMTRESFEDVIVWSKRVCDYRPCIRRIGIFPTEILVEFNKWLLINFFNITNND